MSVQAIQREETYVDPFTAELFASYDNVGTHLMNLKQLLMISLRL